MNMCIIKLSIGCLRAWGRPWEAWCRLRQHLWGIPCIAYSLLVPTFWVSSPHHQVLLYLPLLKIPFSKEHPANATCSLSAEVTSSYPGSGHHSHHLLKKRFWEIVKMISTSTMAQGGLYKRRSIILVDFLLERRFPKIAFLNKNQLMHHVAFLYRSCSFPSWKWAPFYIGRLCSTLADSLSEKQSLEEVSEERHDRAERRPKGLCLRWAEEGPSPVDPARQKSGPRDSEGQVRQER